jgi:predicted dehydrogenase
MRSCSVAVIGYGLAGAAFHAPFIAATPGLRLAAVVTSDEERRSHAQRDHPDAELMRSADEVWASANDLDLVAIAAPNRAHVPLALAALNAGLHVVVDKPLAATAAEGRRVVERAREQDLMLTVFQNRRWDGDFLTLRKLLAARELGRVHRFESRFERWRPEVGAGWREQPAPEDAGGVLFDLGSHLVDQALVLFGPARNVYAELARRRPGTAVDDDAFVALRHESGVVSHLWTSLLAASAGPRFRVLGDRGAFVKRGLDVQEDALRAGRRPDEPGFGDEPAERWGVLATGEGQRRVPTERGWYGAFYEGVARSIAEGAPPPVDPDDAVRALEVLEAARASAVT